MYARPANIASSGLPLLAVLLLALTLRVWGLTWGLPTPTHYFSYHPDESVVLEAAMGMNVFAGHLLPGWYHYGSLSLYLVNFANSLLFVFGVTNIVIKDLAQDHAQWARLYLVGRSLTVLMGVGTVWAVFALGRRLWGQAAGLWAALVLAITPLHAQQSHWLTVDVPAAFWGTLALLWAAKTSDALREGLPGRAVWRCALWAGAFAGLAAATKYNMALAVLPLAWVCLRARRLPLMAAGLAAAVGAFLLGCPGALLETNTFAANVGYEWAHVSHQPGPTFSDTGNGFVYALTHTLDAGLGLPLLVLTLASLVWAARRRAQGDGLLAAFAVPYFVVISLAEVRYARYAVPLLPVLALWAGRTIAEWTAARSRPLFAVRISTVAAVLALTLAECVLLVWPMARTDPRDRALAWLTRAPGPATTVGFAAVPWFPTPPLSPYFCANKPGFWRGFVPPGRTSMVNAQGRAWGLVLPDGDWDSTVLTRTPPHFVVLTEYDYRDALRLHDPKAEAFLALLRQNYTRAATFDAPHTFLTQPRTVDGLPVQNLPYDMIYPNPTVLIYEQRR